MANNDLKILVSAKLNEQLSTKQIQEQLNRISKNLKVNIGIDTKQLKEAANALKQLQNQAAKQSNAKLVNNKDVNEAVKGNKQIYTSIDAAVNKYKEMGQVKIRKVFDPMTQELKGFNLEIQKANGLIEKLKFEAAKLKNVHGVNGFLLTGKEQTDKRSMEMEKALQRTIQNRANEERRLAEAQAKAINKNIDNKQKEIQKSQEVQKQIQKEIELYQRSKQIQANELKHTYGQKIAPAVNNQMAQVAALDPKAFTSMQQFRDAQRNIELGFREINSSARTTTGSVMSFGEAFRTAMVKFCRLV